MKAIYVMLIMLFMACTVENNVEPKVISQSENIEFAVKKAVYGSYVYWDSVGTDEYFTMFCDSVVVRQAESGYELRILKRGIWEDRGKASSWKF